MCPQVNVCDENDISELDIYKLAYEWACNRIEGNPYNELLDEAKKTILAWRRMGIKG